MSFALATLLVGIFAAIVGFGSDAAQSAANKKAVEDTNQTNLDIARETNAANAEQAELAYKRSLPVNQLQDMLAAGMSKPAALQKLAGGGSYSMPTLQSAHMEAPQSNIDFGAFAERLANIPANAEQSQMTSQQLQDLKDIAEQRRRELEMKEELHLQELRERRQRMLNEQREELRKQYGQEVLERTDRLRSRIIELARQKGVSLSSLQSEDDLVSKLGISDEDLWKTAPAASRDNVLEYVRSNALEERALRSEKRAAVAADDSHKREQQNLIKLKQEVQEYMSSKDTRAKQQHVDSIAAAVAETIAEQDELMELYVRGDLFYKDDDGYWHLTQRGRNHATLRQIKQFISGDRSLVSSVLEKVAQLLISKK